MTRLTLITHGAAAAAVSSLRDELRRHHPNGHT